MLGCSPCLRKQSIFLPDEKMSEKYDHSAGFFRGFISLRPLPKPAIFLLVPAHKNLPVFLPSKRSVPATERSFSPSVVGAGITHYTLQYRPSNGCAVRWLRSAIASNRCRSSGVAGPHARSCATKPPVSLDSSGQRRRCLLWNPPQKAKRNVL